MSQFYFNLFLYIVNYIMIVCSRLIIVGSNWILNGFQKELCSIQRVKFTDLYSIIDGHTK